MPDITLILLMVVLAAFLFFQFRSSKRRAREAEERREAMVPGVEVMTNFGLYGTLVSIDDDENTALLAVAPGVDIKVHRQVLLKPAVDPVPETDNADAAVGADGPQLNVSNAIPLSEAEYGERVDPDANDSTGKGKKSSN